MDRAGVTDGVWNVWANLGTHVVRFSHRFKKLKVLHLNLILQSHQILCLLLLSVHQRV
jgi:hypothetical protein